MPEGPYPTLTIIGLREVELDIGTIAERALRSSEAFAKREVLEALMDSERRLFRKSPWRPDTRKWQERKRREGKSTNTLVASGRLQRALETATPPAIRTVLVAGMVWGIPGAKAGQLAYAYYQARQNRGAVDIDEIAVDVILSRVLRYLITGV